MASQVQSILVQRADQIYPTLDPPDIERMRRFGEVRTYPAGEQLGTSGQVMPGLMVILAGKVAVTEHGPLGNSRPINVHTPGNFMGELAQLAGRPTLVDAVAQEPVEALVIPPERLRALMIAEADLGERIMRALILRRVALLDTGAGGPIIVGSADNGDVLRLEAAPHAATRCKAPSARRHSCAGPTVQRTGPLCSINWLPPMSTKIWPT